MSSPPAAPAAQGRVAGRRCVVSGGTSGIGAAIALALAREGARVAVLGRREAEGLAIAARLAAASPGPHAGFVACDVRSPEACAAAVARAAALLGGVDVLVCAAGVVLAGTAEETTEEDWAQTFETNVSGTWRLCKHALPFLCRRVDGASAGGSGGGGSGGVIVTVASDWALVGAQGAAAYCASKGAVVQLTRCLALEHAKDGVRANALCPGDTFVERWSTEGYFAGGRGAGASGPVLLSEAQADARHGGIPLARVASADEIARAALFLASDDSSFMTGQTLVVDGGNTAR
jgi:meso-butanediol dehydrogenase/(S,S)-butanediol dehydrogenase/diacetyl reductase